MSAPMLRHRRRPQPEEYLTAAYGQILQAEQDLRNLRLQARHLPTGSIMEKLERAAALIEATMEEMMGDTAPLSHSA